MACPDFPEAPEAPAGAGGGGAPQGVLPALIAHCIPGSDLAGPIRRGPHQVGEGGSKRHWPLWGLAFLGRVTWVNEGVIDGSTPRAL